MITMKRCDQRPMIMTVQRLIDLLNVVEDKSLEVQISGCYSPNAEIEHVTTELSLVENKTIVYIKAKF